MPQPSFPGRATPPRRFGRPARVWLVALVTVAVLAASCSSGDDDEGGGGDSQRRDDESLDVRGDGGAYEVRVQRTNLLVPHLEADSIADLSFGQGYVNAEDHACTLADQVLMVRSERARYFGAGEGDENLNSDLAYLAMGLYERSEAAYEEQPDDIKDLYQGFADGWNTYLKRQNVEKLNGWCAGEEWVKQISPVDVFAYAKSIMMLASGGQLLDFIATAAPPGAPPDVIAPFVPDTTTTAGPGPSTTAAPDAPSTTGEADTTPSTEEPDSTTTTEGPDSSTTIDEENALGLVDTSTSGSNGWAIGSERSDNELGMLVANPHFPWEGSLRFAEAHLTIPGELNVYGAQLIGVPGIGIGFNENVGWTHTVSAGNRFTAYTLDLPPGSPTSYLYDGETREMEPTDHTVAVRQDDGSMVSLTRTLYTSQYGPILNFPGLGWTDAGTATYRDANIDNDVFSEQYLAMAEADSLDDFIGAHRDITGIPLFNTVAAAKDGQTWYADTSATPNLSDEALAAYETAKTADPIVALAADSGAVLLDGSNSLNEWVDAEGARSPGLIPFDEMPQLERDDFVFNANDSFWLANPDELIDGDYSPLLGDQETARSPRTRENAVVLSDTSNDGPAGEDGKFSQGELQDAILMNRGYTQSALRDEVVDRCTGATTVDIPPLVDDETGAEALPAASIDVAEACTILKDWDGLVNLDSVGAHVWREFISQYPPEALYEAGELWESPFDADEPVDTPKGLAPAPDGGDPVLVNLARAVQIIEAAEWPLDAEMGAIQFAERNGTRVPIHGGDFFEGVTNVVGLGSGNTTEPGLDGGSPLAPTSNLTTEGYPINEGTSFLMVVRYDKGGPNGRVILTYGQVGDPEAPQYTRATEAFSEKRWRTIFFTPDQLAEANTLELYTLKG